MAPKTQNESWKPEGEFKYVTRWAFWLIGILSVVVVIGYFFRPLSMMVERKVLVESHQYQEGMESQIDLWEAQLAEIDHNIAILSITDPLREQLIYQKSVLNVQLTAARKKL